jgi:phospholipid transport system substrate-binding protein
LNISPLGISIKDVFNPKEKRKKRKRKIKMKKLLLLLSLMTSPAFAGPPTEFLSKQVDQVRKMVDTPVADADAKKKLDLDLMNLIRPLMNFPKLSEASLRKHWPKLSDEQKQKFIALFEELVFQNYLKRVRSANQDYQIAYVEEEVKDGGAYVLAEAKSKITVELGFDLIPQTNTKPEDHLYEAKDVLINDVSIVENYRDQFNQILSKESFEVLLERMQSQIDKIKGKVPETEDQKAKDLKEVMDVKETKGKNKAKNKTKKSN